jgi:hypothetical protein
MALILPTADTCVNSGRGYCSSARSEQKPLLFSKFIPVFPESLSENRWSKLAKKWFFWLFWGRRFWRRESGFRTPPGVVSGIRGGGPSSPDGDKCPWWFFISDPPFG